MNKFVSGVSEDIIKECIMAMLVKEVDISKLMLKKLKRRKSRSTKERVREPKLVALIPPSRGQMVLIVLSSAKNLQIQHHLLLVL